METNPVAGLTRIWRLRSTLSFVWKSGPGWTIASAIMILAQGFLPLLLLYAISMIVDLVANAVASGTGVVVDAQFNELIWLVAFAGGVAMAQSFFSAGGRWVGEAQAQAVTDYMFGILHDKSIEVDLAYYENPVHRDKLHRAQRQAPFRPSRIVNSLLEFTRNGFSLLIMGGALVSFNWVVLPIVIVASLPGVFLRLRYASQFYTWTRNSTPRERSSFYTNQMLTTDEFAKELRLFGLGGMLRERFRKLRNELRGERLSVTRKRSIAEFVGEALAVIGVFGVLVWMGHSALAGEISVGKLTLYWGALQMSRTYLGVMLQSVSSLYEDNLFINDLFDFLEIETHVRDPAQPKPLPPPATTPLRLDHVSFKYPHDDRIVLRDVTFDLNPGEHVALVGRNGCGKTTLVKLICRLYDPTGGALRLDGVDVRELDLQEYRSCVGALMQDFCRYQTTLRENIWFGDITQDPNDPRIAEALEGANAQPIIDRLPEGIESMLGVTFQGGHELSTGQWQKVAMARMLARNSPILVLDEPTSAMDPEAEEELIRKFRELAVGRTTLLISHRLAAVRQLDRIIYLENGVVAESGTHDELMELNGGYAHLFTLQSQHYH